MSNLFKKLCFSASSLAIAIPAAAPISAQTTGLTYADTQRCAAVYELWAAESMKTGDPIPPADYENMRRWQAYGLGKFAGLSDQDKQAAHEKTAAMRREFNALDLRGEDRLLFLMPKMTECLQMATPVIAEWKSVSDAAMPQLDAMAVNNETYRYTLTSDVAMRCSVMQSIVAHAHRERGETELARQHEAMEYAWYGIGISMSATNEEATANYDKATALIEKEDSGEIGDEAYARIQLQPCAVLKNINFSAYQDGIRGWKEVRPELFTDNAVMKSQTGLETPALPTKVKMFGDWTFRARGNACTAMLPLGNDAKLILGFNNFEDGRITLSDPKLPKIDYNDDNVEAVEEKHRAGATSDDDFIPMMEAGLTYETYPGTALFIDEKLSAGYYQLWEGREPTSYMLGSLQSYFYPMFPVGKTASIKVLGKEKYRFSIDNPGLWNEMSECIGQYPNG